jgi:hypothetical protein
MRDGAIEGASRARRASAVTALFVALTIFLTYPLAFRAGSAVVNADPDTELFIWTLAWNVHAFTTRPLAIFDANIFFPYANTLAYSENLIGSALLAAPVLWLTGSPVLALNLVTLVSIVLCGLGAFLLARRAGAGFPAAIVAGVVFAFAPSRFFRISQLHLTAVQWIPFALASLHAYFDTGRGRDLRLAAGFFALQALTSGHGAVFLVVATLALLAYRLAIGDPLDLGRRLRDVGWIGLLALLPAVLIVLPYREVQAEMGLRRGLENWAPTAHSFLASPTHVQTWLLSLVPSWRITDRATAILFPGFLPLVLACLAFLRRPGQTTGGRDPAVFYALLTLIALLLVAGPPFGIWPWVYWLPGMSFIRVPSRFMILATLGIAVLAGLGFDRIATLFSHRRRKLVAGIAIALLVAEFTAIPFGLDPYQLKRPAADRWLDGQPKPFSVAEVPVVMNERYQTAYMLHSTAHWQRTVHGYSGMRPPLHERLFRELTRFPDNDSLESLAALHVTYVVVHIGEYAAGEWPAIEQRLRQYETWLKLEYEDRDSRVYSLTRK